MGGMFGESKFDILKKIPEQYIPKSVLIKIPVSTADTMRILAENELTLPLIFKPDLGERGFMVNRINTQADIESYLKKIKTEFIVQQLVDYPIELGVFYTRFPDAANGHVTSVVMKEMLTVTGDGETTLQELILKKDRAKLQWHKLQVMHRDSLKIIVPKDEVIELVSIGNHCLGTKFLDAGYLINEQLSAVFDHISKKIEGFYFGRFDLRCASLEDLYNGKVKIMELNGCGAEPAHIYQPGYSLVKAISVLLKHWHSIAIIARQNHKRGIPYTSVKNAYQYYQSFKTALSNQ
jgi:hypothetical protein